MNSTMMDRQNMEAHFKEMCDADVSTVKSRPREINIGSAVTDRTRKGTMGQGKSVGSDRTKQADNK